MLLVLRPSFLHVLIQGTIPRKQPILNPFEHSLSRFNFFQDRSQIRPSYQPQRRKDEIVIQTTKKGNQVLWLRMHHPTGRNATAVSPKQCTGRRWTQVISTRGYVIPPDNHHRLNRDLQPHRNRGYITETIDAVGATQAPHVDR